MHCVIGLEVGSIMAESLNSAISREGWDLTLRISLGLRPECGGARDSEELWQTRFLGLELVSTPRLRVSKGPAGSCINRD